MVPSKSSGKFGDQTVRQAEPFKDGGLFEHNSPKATFFFLVGVSCQIPCSDNPSFSSCEPRDRKRGHYNSLFHLLIPVLSNSCGWLREWGVKSTNQLWFDSNLCRTCGAGAGHSYWPSKIEPLVFSKHVSWVCRSVWCSWKLLSVLEIPGRKQTPTNGCTWFPHVLDADCSLRYLYHNSPLFVTTFSGIWCSMMMIWEVSWRPWRSGWASLALKSFQCGTPGLRVLLLFKAHGIVYQVKAEHGNLRQIWKKTHPKIRSEDFPGG